MEPSFLSKHDKVNSPFFHDFQDIANKVSAGICFVIPTEDMPIWHGNWSTCIQETTQDAAQDLSDLGVDELGRSVQNL